MKQYKIVCDCSISQGRQIKIPWKGLKLSCNPPFLWPKLASTDQNSLEGIETKKGEKMNGSAVSRQIKIPWKGLKHFEDKKGKRHQVESTDQNSLEGIETPAYLTLTPEEPQPCRQIKIPWKGLKLISHYPKHFIRPGVDRSKFPGRD